MVKALKRLVQDAINAEDPLGLLRGGAPEDEYDQEVELVLGGLVQCGPDEPAIAALVGRVFDKMFWQGAVSDEGTERIARSICKGWGS